MDDKYIYKTNIMEKDKKYSTIEDYISLFPKEIRVVLERIRKVIRNSAPQAKETISYRIPTYKLKGNLVHFAAFKDHIGFFPTPSGIVKFKRELKKYSTSKGTIRFKLNEPVPYDLIKRIVKFRVKENINRYNEKPSYKRH